MLPELWVSPPLRPHLPKKVGYSTIAQIPAPSHRAWLSTAGVPLTEVPTMCIPGYFRATCHVRCIAKQCRAGISVMLLRFSGGARCHPDDRGHTSSMCWKECMRMRPPSVCPRLHPCPKACGEDCGPCMVVEETVVLPCGHVAHKVPCHLANSPEAFHCR